MRELTLVHNAGDEPLPGIHHQRADSALGARPHLIVHPTPQATGSLALIRDTMRALGKDPRALPTGTPGELWRLARAWMRAHGVRHVVVDRAHLLADEQIRALAEVECDLTLIWSNGQAPRIPPLERDRNLRVQNTYTFAVTLSGALRQGAAPPTPPPTVDVPDLPLVDFPRFRAACRDRLGRAAFARVDEIYQATLARTLDWEQGARDGDFTVSLTAYLRDGLIGALVDPHLALLRVRAAQAALLRTGWLLRWNTTRLGPDPAAALRGHLDLTRTHRLYRHYRTDHVAATVLALHLDQDPRFFDTITGQDVTPAGQLQWQHPPTIPVYPTRYSIRRRRHPPLPEPRRDRYGTEYEELTGAVRLPAHIRLFMAAHLAHRHHQGALDIDPFFVHPDYVSFPRGRSPVPGLLTGVRALCRDLFVDRPWTHSTRCQDGDGRTPRLGGWMRLRGLSLSRLPGARG
ncbi:hypothetical protein PWG71_08350 [Nocardiopsis sp. N85]|uniref:hypothetical protein n=1 Tax=Nocardiopsis sp. N85 TaxID=3029400 RepID=UPI00237FB32A|nr:hypothetical protein [Nocardiopsis sp. N85]MDE3721397.1 hypothetical protein [Nocardiopsis sp. N85]